MKCGGYGEYVVCFRGFDGRSCGDGAEQRYGNRAAGACFRREASVIDLNRVDVEGLCLRHDRRQPGIGKSIA